MVTIGCKDVTFPDIQAIVFDKDGTLANSELFLRNLSQRRARLIDAKIPGVQEPLLMAFGVDGNRINPSGLMAVGTRQENEIAAAAYVAETGRDWLEALTLVRNAFTEADYYLQRKADHTPLIEGALELLKMLSAAGLKLGILSADSSENIREFATQYAIEPYFHAFIGVDGQLNKADPNLLDRCFTALGVAPAHTLMVGDSPLDVEIARTTAMAGCIGMTGGWQTPPVLAQADSVVAQLSDIRIVA